MAAKSRRKSIALKTECYDDLLGGPITIQFPGSIAADTQDEAEKRVREWFTHKTEDEKKEFLIPRNCSGLIVDPCPAYECEGGRCEFDYEIAKVTVTQVKPAGTTAKLHKPTKPRWDGSLEVWWGCFCQELF